MRKISVTLITALFAVSGCANYQVGDLSHAYCNEADPLARRAIKAQLSALGVILPLDYCLSRALLKGVDNARTTQ